MNRSDLITALREYAGFTTVDATAAIDGVFGVILSTLKRGESVDLKGVGSFLTVRTNARVGRNPFNGDSVDIPAKTVPKFKFSKVFKEAVNVSVKKGRSRL